jgi:transposase
MDGSLLLTRAYSESTPAWLREVPAVGIMRRTRVHQFLIEDGQLRLRSKDDLPPASLRQDSPYDPEARLRQQTDDHLDRIEGPSDRDLR